MARSQNSFIKKKKADQKRKKQQEKLERKLEKKNKPKSTEEDMMAYLDEDGNIVSSPPSEKNETTDQADKDNTETKENN